MKALTLKTTQTRINSAVTANNESNLQELFVNVVFHGLIHGNIMPNAMKALRDSNVASKFKAGVNKYMPIKWDKKAAKYTYNKAKAEKLLGELELVREDSTLEEVAAALPDLFEKKETAPTEYNRAAYLANVAKKLTKEGESEVELVMGITAALLENPELVAAAAAAVFSSAKTEKAA